MGIDFSEPLLQIAKQHHCPKNVRYECRNVLDLTRKSTALSGSYGKILMFGALQHFETTQLEKLISIMLDVSSDRLVIVLGFIPDIKKKYVLHDTWPRRIQHVVRRIANRDRMGTWWDKDFIQAVCRRLHVQCTFHQFDAELSGAPYRFSVRITRA